MSTTSDLVSHHYEKLPGTGDEVGRFNIIHIPSCRDATGIHVSVVVLNSLRTEAIEHKSFTLTICAIAKQNPKGVAAMSEYLNEMIGYQVEGTAEWRREKAMQFPNDARNLRAAEELGRLAAEIDALRDSEVEKQISEAHQTLNDASNGEVWMDLNETVSAELREIGFHKGHVTTTELLEWYRDLLRGKRDDLIETAKREEAAEADPAVGAAKAALDNAKAALERAQADLNAVQDLAYAKLLRRQRLRVLSDY